MLATFHSAQASCCQTICNATMGWELPRVRQQCFLPCRDDCKRHKMSETRNVNMQLHLLKCDLLALLPPMLQAAALAAFWRLALHQHEEVLVHFTLVCCKRGSVRLGNIAIHSKVSGCTWDADVKPIQILFGDDLASKARPANYDNHRLLHDRLH